MKKEKKSSIFFGRVAGLALLIFVLRFSFSNVGGAFHGYVDLRAALLVFLAPIALVLIFAKGGASMAENLRFAWQSSAGATPESLRESLHEETAGATGAYGTGKLARLSESHPDPFVRYATGLVVSRFEGEELARLLSRRIEAEDERWQGLCQFVGFLAKMSPYFGMLATVIGMIRLLENLDDFTRISGSMALAMQGTLYGLVSFTLLYAPLQRFFQGQRERIFARNELAARWVTLVAAKADPVLVREELRSRFAESEAPAVAVPAASSARGAAALGSKGV